MKFEPGRAKTGGRTEGVANRATAEFKEFCQRFMKSAEYRDNLQSRILKGRADHMEKYMAELLHGRPRQEFDVSDKLIRVIIQRDPAPTTVIDVPALEEHTQDEA